MTQNHCRISPNRALTSALALSASAALFAPGCADRADVRIGSKQFTESVILGDIATGLIRDSGAAAQHRRELGGTTLVWNALLAGEIDAYPEYTGTIHEELLPAGGAATDSDMRKTLAARGVLMTGPLGFNDTYAVGMKEEVAARLGIRTISDLAAHPELPLGFSHEFLDRADGWPSLRDRYRFTGAAPTGLVHDLAYRALASGAIAATDLYSTDAEIPYYQLRVLEDDRRHFPDYQAVFLYRADLAARAPRAAAALERLAGRISAEEMQALNARAKLDRIPEPRVAADWLAADLGVRIAVADDGRVTRVLRRTREHLFMVLASLLAAIAAAVPLGILAARWSRAGQGILAVVGTIQTIPSLALLVFMIPLFGIGTWPAIVALFLYSLLPIVRNTSSGLASLPVPLRESAEALGLPPFARLRLVELPMASPSILAGIKTSAVINVGTATLGALIGAGGYGQPIMTGIRLDDMGLILEGAIPAAALALLAQALFELLERTIVPRGLRLRR